VRARRTLSLYGWLYVFILPGVVLLFLFAYIPMLGVQIAFKDFVIYKGMWSSPWVGLKYFYFLGDPVFWQSFVNTILITGFRFLFGFPAPIILALMLNEVQSVPFKRTVQSFSYLPHFISWIVVSYILYTFLQMDTGPMNMLLTSLGVAQVNFMGIPHYFRPIVIISAIWKEIGWGTIIYLAALSGIDPQLYEAAMIDGAGRFRRIVSINVPGIMPTISILLILSLPGLTTAGYEQIYPLVNPTNLGVSNVLDVYLIRLGLTQAQYSVATAIGLILAAVNITIVLGSNWAAKRLGQTGFW
jgi:putative aldouronate transport system permease protein